MGAFAIAITKEELTTQLSNDKHWGIADEPAEIGGQDKGPTPYDLLVSALASCTSITLRMYANRKGWIVDKIRVRVDYSRSYEEDCRDGKIAQKKIDVFNRNIKIDGDLEPVQRKRMLEIADKCPVHKTLETASKVYTTLED